MDRIKNGKDELQKTMYEVSGKMYQQVCAPGRSQRRAQPGGDPNQGGANGNVYDADYKEVDDDHKE